MHHLVAVIAKGMACLMVRVRGVGWGNVRKGMQRGMGEGKEKQG